MQQKKRVVIVGGGFGGVYTAMYLQSYLKKQEDFEIALINRENYFVYQPMLAEVIGGSLEILDTVSPLHKLVPKAELFVREVCGFDLEKRRVEMIPCYTHEYYYTEYDHLILAGGNITDFRNSPGLHEHAFAFKNLADCLRIRNHIIDVISTASKEKDPAMKQQFLTFVVGGGGFSGSEAAAEINDFARRLAKKYKTIDPTEIKVYLIHMQDRLMKTDLSASLSHYAEKILRKRGVEILFNTALVTATSQRVHLSNGEEIPTRTVISTAPSSPNPIFEGLDLPKERGRIKTDGTLQVLGTKNIWAIGDCALIPLVEGICPPTAQFAIREAKVLAHNVVATIRNQEKKTFYFKSLGMMGALGHHNAVGELFGKIKISGFLAWLMWRFIYWYKLPGLTRKIKVIFSWMLDTVFPIEDVQLKLESTKAIAQLHFTPGEIIFHEGDIGDYLYIIMEGEVEVLKQREGKDVRVATLGQGAFFGEYALLNERKRTATIRALKPTDLIALQKSDFGTLVANFSGLKHEFETAAEARKP